MMLKIGIWKRVISICAILSFESLGHMCSVDKGIYFRRVQGDMKEKTCNYARAENVYINETK